MAEITEILDTLPGAEQSSDVEDIMAEMERRSQAQKGQKP